MSDYQPTLIVPGLHQPSADHWQSWWQRRDRNSLAVEHGKWHVPDLEAWADAILQAMHELRGEVWIVAYGFGCLASLKAAQSLQARISGLQMIAPPDPDKFGVAERLPQALEIPSILVASRQSPTLCIEKARHWAGNLGSHFSPMAETLPGQAYPGADEWQQGFDLFGRFKREIGVSRFCRGSLIQ